MKSSTKVVRGWTVKTRVQIKNVKDRFWMSPENHLFVELLLKDNKWSIANIILSILFFWPSEMVLVFELFLVKNLMSFEFLSFNAQATRSK